MMYLDTYDSPVGTLSLASDGPHLCGLWLEGQKYFQAKLETRLGMSAPAKGRKKAAIAQGADASLAGGAANEAVPAPERLEGEAARAASAGLAAARAWLDAYFAGRDPGALPPVALHGTPFQEEVWAELALIPYGQLTTYGAIAQALSRKHGGKNVSARAVGVAVGKNPVSIIVPCHRVVGATGSLTGYAGGIARKVKLLKLEGVDTSKLKVPTKGTAL